MENEVEKLARMSADEFSAIRKDMVTKDEFSSKTAEILQAINDLGLHVNAWMSDTEHRFTDVEQRLRVVEEKVHLR